MRKRNTEPLPRLLETALRQCESRTLASRILDLSRQLHQDGVRVSTVADLAATCLSFLWSLEIRGARLVQTLTEKVEVIDGRGENSEGGGGEQ